MGAVSIARYRVCGNTELVKSLDLGCQAATGMSSESPGEQAVSGPLEWIKCVERPGGDICGLVQLR